MDLKGFIGPAYDLRNVQYDCQTLSNWYIETNELGLGKQAQPAQLIPRRGLANVLSGFPGVSRGGYVASNNVLYWVFGNSLYRIVPVTNSLTGWTSTLLSSAIAGGTAPVEMTDNTIDMFILSSTGIFIYNFAEGTVNIGTGGAYAPASSMAFFDSYIVFSKTNTQQFFWTDLLSRSASALNFASAEANPERVVGLINNNLDLWIFGRKSTELWYNYGQNNTVFSRRQNLLIETGCIAPKTIKKINNTIMWVSSDDRGGAQVMIANGYTPTRVSTFPLEAQWQSMPIGDLETASAYAFQDGGHHFYVLNIPGARETYVYDLTSSQMLGKPCWSTWTSSDGNGTLSRHLGQGHAFFNGWHITGDYTTGNLYAMDANTFEDNGKYIVWERTTPHISNEMNRIFYDRLQLDFLTGTTTNQLQDPQIMMQHSSDGGFTWSDERWETAGKTGEYSRKVDYSRLGSGRNRVFRIRTTDPMYWAVSGASIMIRTGTN